MTAPADLPPDAITTEAAARLLGLGPERVRQLVKQGYVVKIGRGMTTATSAVQGYCKFLRDEARRSPASTAATRSHDAKAALIEASTARRRAELIDLASAEHVVNRIARTAVTRLRKAPMDKGLTPSTRKVLSTEINAACRAIEAARDRALAALNTGDLRDLGGGDE